MRIIPTLIAQNGLNSLKVNEYVFGFVVHLNCNIVLIALNN